MFSPIDPQRTGLLTRALCNIKPFVRERAAHTAEHSAIDQVPDGSFHHAPCRRGGKEHRLFCSKQSLKTRMNRSVKIFKISPRCPIIGRENAAQVFSDTSTGPGMKSLS